MGHRNEECDMWINNGPEFSKTDKTPTHRFKKVELKQNFFVMPSCHIIVKLLKLRNSLYNSQRKKALLPSKEQQ